MTRYLLDTDICIFYFRRKHDAEAKIEAAGQGNIHISEITLAELFVGMYKSEHLAKRQQELRTLLEIAGVVPIRDSLPLYGQERARLEELGTPIADFDLLIATTALHHGMTLVTNNTKHHARVADLQLANWATS